MGAGICATASTGSGRPRTGNEASPRRARSLAPSTRAPRWPSAMKVGEHEYKVMGHGAHRPGTGTPGARRSAAGAVFELEEGRPAAFAGRAPASATTLLRADGGPALRTGSRAGQPSGGRAAAVDAPMRERSRRAARDRGRRLQNVKANMLIGQEGLGRKGAVRDSRSAATSPTRGRGLPRLSEDVRRSGNAAAPQASAPLTWARR